MQMHKTQPSIFLSFQSWGSSWFHSKGKYRFWLRSPMPWMSTMLRESGLSFFSDAQSVEQGRKDLIFQIILSTLNIKLFKFIMQIIYSLTGWSSIDFLYLLRPAGGVWQLLDSQSMLWVFMAHWAFGNGPNCVSVKGSSATWTNKDLTDWS